MKMKFIYSSPELEMIDLSIAKDVLAVSDPMGNTPIGGGTGQDKPGTDPFGDLLP